MSDIKINLNPASSVSSSSSKAGKSTWVKTDEKSSLQPSASGAEGPSLLMSRPILAFPSSQTIDKMTTSTVISKQLETWLNSIKELGAQLNAMLNSPSYLAVFEQLKQLQAESKGEYPLGTTIQMAIDSLLATQKNIEAIQRRMAGMVSSGIALESDVIMPLVVNSVLLSEQVMQKRSDDIAISHEQRLSEEKKAERTATESKKQTIRFLDKEIELALIGMVMGKKSTSERPKKKTVIGDSQKESELDDVRKAAEARQQQPLPALEMMIPIPLINLMIITMVYQTAWQSASEDVSAKDKTKKVDMRMAENFAKEIIKKIADPNFAKELGGEYTKHLVVMYKLIFAAAALALLYVVEAGRVTPEEFQGMLKGEIKIPKDTLMGTLIGFVKELLKNLAPEEKEKVLEGFYEFLDGHPDPSKMLEPARIFRNILSYPAPLPIPNAA